MRSLPPRLRSLFAFVTGRIWVPWLVALVSCVLFRVPPLVNARGINSDAAAVALQALHLGEGDNPALLWGTTYQASLDAYFVRGLYAIFGPTPLAVMLSPTLGMLVMVTIVFAILSRFLKPWSVLCCVVPLIVATMAINSPMVYVMRQTLATTVMLALLLCWKAAPWRRPWPWFSFFVAGLLLGVATWIDYFAIVLLAPALIAVAGAAHEGARERPGIPHARTWKRTLLGAFERFAFAGVGLKIGLMVADRLRGEASARVGEKTALAWSRVEANLTLLKDTCLPFSIGTKVLIKREELHAKPWTPPEWFASVQTAAGWVLVFVVLFGLLAIVLPKTPRALRWFAASGLTAIMCALAGFSLSSMSSDAWSARYLAPMLWFAPFLLAAFVWRFPRIGWVALAPYFVAAGVTGWLSYGTYVSGPLVRRDPRGIAQEEQRLLSMLKIAGVEAASAHYWLAYRLTFLWKEQLIVVPLNPTEDRYPPYRKQYNASLKKALLFHPSEPRANHIEYERMLAGQKVDFETRHVQGFTVILFEQTY